MNSHKKLFLFSIGGAAVAAGAYYYFYKRNLTTADRYQKQLKQFQYEVFRSKQLYLGNLNLKYDQLLHLATFDENDNQRTIIEKIQYQPIEDLQNLGTCSKSMNNGSYYYECLECSPIRQELTKTNKIAEQGQVYLILCEDCFQVAQHKDHKFIRHNAGNNCNFKCHCGEANMMNKECFCDNHQGYEKLKELFENQQKLQPILWQGVEQFLLDCFHMIFDSMSDLEQLKQSNKITQQLAEQKKERINYLIKLLVDKINEIIELNPPSIHFIPNILQKKLNKPISVQFLKNQSPKDVRSEWQIEFLKVKKINTELSIYEYLLLFYSMLDDQSDKLLCELFRSLLKVDDTFCLVFCQKFFKMIVYAVRPQNQKLVDGTLNEGMLSSMSFLVMEYICLQNVFEYLIDTLGVAIFTPLDFFIVYLNEKPRASADMDEVVYLLLNICFEMFRFVNQLKILLQRYPNELIEKLNLLCLSLFKQNSLILDSNNRKNTPENVQEKCSQMIGIFQFTQLEKHAIYCYINICEGLLLINDEQLTKKVLPILCQNFVSGVEKARDFIENGIQKGTYFTTFSVTLLTHLPLLVALSERKIFSKSVIQSFFDQYLIFDSNQSKSRFFTSLHMIFERFALLSSKPNILQQMESWNHLMQNPQLLQVISAIQQSLQKFFFSSFYRVYDFFALTYSILLLIDDTDYSQNKYHLQYLQMSNQNLLINRSRDLVDSFTKLDQTYLTTQLLLDSTPFFNVFSTSYKLYFQDLNSLDDNETKRLFSKNVQEIIIASIQEYDPKKMYLKDVQELCSNVLTHTDIIKEYIGGISKQDQKGNVEEQEDINLMPQFKEKFYSRHLLRKQCNDLENVIKIICKRFSDSQEEYTFMGSDFKLENLFPYQKELYIKIYLNEQYVKQIMSVHFHVNYSHIISRTINTQVLQIVKLIKQQAEQVELLNEEQKSQIQIIKASLQAEQLYALYNTQMDFLKQREFFEWYQTNKAICQILNEIKTN